MIGNGGNAYPIMSVQSMDRASVARARGSGTGLTYRGSLWLNAVANRSTCGRNQCDQIDRRTSLERVYSVFSVM